MSEYIAYPFYATDMPVDISFLFAKEKPAGRHGFLVPGGKTFAFEDGTPARFWGVNLNGGACFPGKEFAGKLARRLAKTGVNMVRFHQLDAQFDTPNIFAFTKGPLVQNTRALDPVSMEHLDYFIKCLKDEGIYVYLDLLTYRRFKTGDGVENAHRIEKNAGRPYALFDPGMIELQKEYATEIFTHVNPYTGLAYKDEPAIVLTEIANEDDLFSNKFTLEPYTTQFRRRFRRWLEENGYEYDAENGELYCMAEPVVRFKEYLHDTYYKTMYDHLRSIGVRIPITGTNWTQHASLFFSNEKLDFTDSHSYFYDWRWGEREKYCMNRSCTQNEDFGMVKLAHMCSLDKPFFVSEWDVPWPNEFRADSSLLWASIGAFQGWGGFCIHTYSYLPEQLSTALLGKEIAGDGVGGTPYREGIFSVWNDPAKYGLFYHAAIVTRRGDVTAAKETAAVKMDPYHAKERAPGKELLTESAQYNAGFFDTMAPALTCLSEAHKVGVTDKDRTDVDYLLTKPEPLVDLSKKEVRSDTGELYRSWEKQYGVIDTEKTQCVYGFLEKNGPISTRDMTVTCQTDYAVIAMSALCDAPLNRADNILLTTVGRARNHNAQFDGEKLIQWGESPIEVEVIHAEIALKTENPNLKVYAITPEGCEHGAIASKWEDGVLRFTLGEHWRSMYYLIQAE